MILGFADYEQQGRRLAEALGLPFAPIAMHRFPDGESKITLPPSLPPSIALCRSLDHPNDKLVELLLAVETARSLGAAHITLVAPYLCYMRQDIAFNPGEAVSQRIIGRFLAGLVDAVITVDPHLHRITHLSEAVEGIPAITLSSAPAMGSYLAQWAEGAVRPLLVGPDSESEQWVGRVATQAGLEYEVASKRRLGDREVTITLPLGDHAGRDVMLVDDMASTGRTLINVTRELQRRGVASVRCLITHALHSEETGRMMREAGIVEIGSCDSISHPSNAISLTPLLAEAVGRVMNGGTVAAA